MIAASQKFKENDATFKFQRHVSTKTTVIFYPYNSLAHFHALLYFVVTISILLLIINSTSDALYINQLKMTVRRFYRSMSFKLLSFVVFFKI